MTYSVFISLIEDEMFGLLYDFCYGLIFFCIIFDFGGSSLIYDEGLGVTPKIPWSFAFSFS